jgi:alkanesulfonate monooxygenase SsuD/methylene tetrahydromethanopterin reductase-like flavin-dependent oxidoreductase (luciferase family)
VATEVGKTFDFRGEHYELVDSPALPKPAQDRIPVLIGGHGATRTPRLAGRYADEFNMPFASIEDSERQFGRVRQAALEAGRAADDLVYCNALVVCVGKDDQEVARRAAAIGRQVDELKLNGLAGSPDEVVDKIGRYQKIGSRRIYLQLLDLSDLDHLELISSQVQSQLS